MALVSLSSLLWQAREQGYAVGYFEAWDTYSIEAVIEAAEQEEAPVVIGFGGMMMDQPWIDRHGIEALGAYGRVMAQRASVPCAFILNEVWELEHAHRGVGSGYNAVMINSADLDYGDNVARNRQLVAWAHPCQVEVQGELGRLPNFGEDDISVLTDPDQAQEYVNQTGIDCLAISIGNQHLRTEGRASIDLDRLRAIRKCVDVPLTMHGGSGFPEEIVAQVIREGIALFHVGTILKRRYLEQTRQYLRAMQDSRDWQGLVGCRKQSDFLMPGKLAIGDAVRAGIRLYGASGKAVCHAG
jgi:fructose-bisphosphate aldolase class II